MKLHAHGFGKRVDVADLKMGDVFTAVLGSTDVLCLAFEARDQGRALVLSSREGGNGAGSAGPIKVRLLSELGGPFIKLKERFAVQPIPASHASATYFPPKVLEEAEAGDLVITDDGGLYVHVQDAASDLDDPVLVDLTEGECRDEAPGSFVVHPAWELAILKDGVPERVLARFDRKPAQPEAKPPMKRTRQRSYAAPSKAARRAAQPTPPQPAPVV